MIADWLQQSTILSWHREADGSLKVFIECSYCELVEEFITVEAAVAFGTIHRRGPLHVQNFLKSRKENFLKVGNQRIPLNRSK